MVYKNNRSRKPIKLGLDGSSLTTQEHKLMGSSAGDPKNPYMAIGLIHRHYSRDEIEAYREGKRTTAGGVWYFDIPGLTDQGDRGAISVTLEPLGPDGRTIRDPQPLDDDGNLIASYTKSDNFPYRRD